MYHDSYRRHALQCSHSYVLQLIHANCCSLSMLIAAAEYGLYGFWKKFTGTLAEYLTCCTILVCRTVESHLTLPPEHHWCITRHLKTTALWLATALWLVPRWPLHNLLPVGPCAHALPSCSQWGFGTLPPRPSLSLFTACLNPSSTPYLPLWETVRHC